MHVITNGFDPEYFHLDDAPRERPSSFSILHAGELYRAAIPVAFFDALVGLSLPTGTKPLQVTFLGKSSDPRDDWPKEIRGRGLENVVRFSGHVEYAQALRHMQTSDILLLLEVRASRGHTGQAVRVFRGPPAHSRPGRAGWRRGLGPAQTAVSTITWHLPQTRP